MEADIIFRGLTFVILILFSGVFAGVFLFDRKQRFAGWLSLAYLSGLLAFLFDIGRAFFDPVISDIIAKSMLWCFSIALVIAIYSRYRSKLPLANIAAIIGIGAAALIWYSFVEPDVIKRSVFSATTAGLILTCALPILWKKRQGTLESIMFGLILTICIIYFARPIIVYGVMDAIHSTATYQTSAYAAILHASSAVCALACGVTMLIIAGHDIIAKQQLLMTIDPLTGLLNRRGLDELVDREIAPDHEKNSRQSVITFDLDHFKQVNDRFGHEAGDAVLRRVSATINGLIVKQGKAARIGGEEFVIILNPLSSKVGAAIADQLRVAIAMLVHPELGNDYRVTSSFGLTQMEPGESFTMALRRADSALYRAKAEGRNRIVEAKYAGSEKRVKRSA